ncbi:hypothetical protein KAW65_08815 [candidate division WOR-3 bacterium]|nr:hypothetical protein [candidate division WOR-3 bacterium]
MKKWFFMWLLFPLIAQSAFEAIDCESETIFENPVAIFTSGIQVLHSQAFGILPYSRISYSHPTHIGFGISNFGIESYRENEILLGYGIKRNKIKLGAFIRGLFLQIENHGSEFGAGLDFGASFQIASSTNFSFTLQNLISTKIADEKIPKRISGDLVMAPRPDFKIKIKFYKEAYYPLEVRIRNEIKLSNLLGLGIGIKTCPQSFSFGVLLSPNKLGLSYYARTHPTLGLTHIVGIKYG